MYRVVVLHEREPDTDSYAEHAELCTHVPDAGKDAYERGFPQPSVLFADIS